MPWFSKDPDANVQETCAKLNATCPCGANAKPCKWTDDWGYEEERLNWAWNMRNWDAPLSWARLQDSRILQRYGRRFQRCYYGSKKTSGDARCVMSLWYCQGVDIYFFLESFGVYTSHFSLTFRWFDGQPLTFTHEITGVVLSRSWLMSSHLHFRAEEVFLGKRSGLRCHRLALTHKKNPWKLGARWFHLFNQLEISVGRFRYLEMSVIWYILIIWYHLYTESVHQVTLW